MNELFVKILEALRGEGMFSADFNDKDGATIFLQKEDRFYEVKIKGRGL